MKHFLAIVSSLTRLSHLPGKLAGVGYFIPLISYRFLIPRFAP